MSRMIASYVQAYTASAMNKLANDRKGVTALEYGVIAAVIVIGIVGALGTLKGNLTNLFNNVGSNL